ncbi:hypothetical protein ACWCQS_40780 [Streptomyces sp. NPDC002076]
MQRGGGVVGAAVQVLLASIGSLTSAATASAILTAADIGTKVSPTAQSWHPMAAVLSNITFLIVLAGMLLGSRHDVVDLSSAHSPCSQASCSPSSPSPTSPPFWAHPPRSSSVVLRQSSRSTTP